MASPLVLPRRQGWGWRRNPDPIRCPDRNTQTETAALRPPHPHKSLGEAPLHRAMGTRCPPGSGSLGPIPLPPCAGTRGRKQQLLSKSASAGSRKKSLRSQLAQLESKSPIPPTPRLPAPSVFQTRRLVHQPSKPCSTKLRLLLLLPSFRRRPAHPRLRGELGFPGPSRNTDTGSWRKHHRLCWVVSVGCAAVSAGG